jgi:hypothetical protein
MARDEPFLTQLSGRGSPICPGLLGFYALQDSAIQDEFNVYINLAVFHIAYE